MFLKMKRLVMIFAAAVISLTAQAMRQDVGGRVIDEKGEGLSYVNVVLLSLPDSVFIQGAVTDEQGYFHIKSVQDGGLLKISCVGYETMFIKAVDGQTISMKEETEMLGEVVVKSTLPKTRVAGDAMRTTVSGSILEKAGTVSDMLSKIPSLEAERDAGVKVLGRGDAEVYINGRRIVDVKELSRLRADQIQYVEVVHNPGARYAASTKAVVRIQLKKMQGEGLSLQEYASGMYEYGYTLTNNLDLNYRTGGLDITGSFWCGRYGHSKSLQANKLTYFVGSDRYEGISTQESQEIWKGWSPQLQVNYMIDENHSFGAFYKYDRHPNGDFAGWFHTDNYENGTFTERSESDICQTDQFRKHIFNAYYNGKVGRLSIDLNVDGLFDDTQEPGSTIEKTTVIGEPVTSRAISSKTLSSNDFWASKLILSYPLWKGSLSVGGEYSYTHRTDSYNFNADEAVPVKATDTEINERSSAAFVEYGRPFGKLFTQVGLRYEHLKNDYYDFQVRQDEVCRNYGDWFPTASVAMPIGQVQLALAYRQDIERPHYSNLTSRTIYINRYTFQSGNPYLKPTYTHSLVLNAGYKWTSLNVSYARTRGNVTMATEPYPGIADPKISLVRPINGSDGYDRLSFNASLRPTIDFSLSSSNCSWHPMWAAILIMQNYETPCAAGDMKRLNHPLLNLTWDNDIELPKGWRLNLQMKFNTRGDYTNYRVERCQFNSRLGLQRDFNLHHLGQLTADMRLYDPFNTNKTSVTIYGMRDITSTNPARRTFFLDITWKFNEARSKYRGSGAGDKQKARM